MIGVEASGYGIESGAHAATLNAGIPGVLHGARSYLLQDDYPGVGPEHSFLKESGRAEYVTASDEEAVAALKLLARTEGIIPALESAHALACVTRMAPGMARDQNIVVSLSGRGDKDMETVAEYDGATRGQRE